MVDRALVYPGELPRSADILLMNKATMYGLGYLSQAMIGATTAVAGLGISATSPPSLAVNIGAGSIYSMAQADASSYAGLGTDPNVIMKQGLTVTPTTLVVTPPSTAGYSQVYLVQAQYQDVDAGQTVLPYYNAANPSTPYAGPANNGQSQYTLRQGVCTISLVAGVAAPTGTQANPSPTAGATGLYYITVANGATSLTSANWVQVPGAPFLTGLLTTSSAGSYLPAGAGWLGAWIAQQSLAQAVTTTLNFTAPSPAWGVWTGNNTMTLTQSGLYLVILGTFIYGQWSTSSVNGLNTEIVRNGSIIACAEQLSYTGTTYNFIATTSCVVNCAVNDYIQAGAYLYGPNLTQSYTSGGPSNGALQNFLNIIKLA